MSFAIFEKYSHTSEKVKQDSLHPLKVRISIGKTYDLINKYIQSLEPIDIVRADDYYDVCMLDQNYFEISFQLTFESGLTYVNVSVYGDHKRGKTRKRLYRVLDDLRETFKQYL